VAASPRPPSWAIDPAVAGRATAWAGRAHARLRADLLTQSPRRGGSIISAGSGEELLKLVVRRHLTTCVSNMGTSKIAYRQQLNMKIIRITYTPKGHLDYR